MLEVEGSPRVGDSDSTSGLANCEDVGCSSAALIAVGVSAGMAGRDSARLLTSRSILRSIRNCPGSRDAKGTHVDNHLTGVDGLYIWRQAGEPGKLHLWLVSYERIALVAHYSAPWPAIS